MENNLMITMRPIRSLKPYKKNPRINDGAVAYVKSSIQEFGFKVPLVIDSKGVIITGHTRLKAAKKLGMKEVPCIVADDLSPDQIKAFRLADNKVSEMAEWDTPLLNDELEDLLELNFDMEQFGFELDFDLPTDTQESSEEDKENARMNTMHQYNLEYFDADRVVGWHQMPVLTAVDHVPRRLIGFNYMLNTTDPDAGIHFYVDDYQFERVWQRPDFYVERMQEFDCMLTPDFSLYMDMPRAMKVWNIYRSRLIGQIAQDYGITVIPTVSWAEEDTFDFCFDGLPLEATLSVSTIGVKRAEDSFSVWKAGMDEMIRRLKPKRLIVYGGKVDYDYQGIEVHYFDNEVTERMKERGKE